LTAFRLVILHVCFPAQAVVHDEPEGAKNQPDANVVVVVMVVVVVGGIVVVVVVVVALRQPLLLQQHRRFPGVVAAQVDKPDPSG
jgi:hypothetical protein